jgi:hypothetical protein
VLISKPISAISQSAPAVVTATAHGCPDGWQAAVVSAKGMTQINATRYPPSGDDWDQVSVIDANNVALVDTNSADATAYTSGGFLVYSTPGLQAGMTATMTFYDPSNVTGAPLLTLTSASGITLDFSGKTINPLLATVGLAWNSAYYRLDVTDTSGVTTEVMNGILKIQ